MTDYEADVKIMEDYTGYYNSYFLQEWLKFAPLESWDGQSCSEIACCVSYMARYISEDFANNINKIFVSNYAQGLYNLFSAASRVGHTPIIGAFVWFDYGDGNGLSHTGRVMWFDSANVHTFEGNVGGMTRQRDYPINDPQLAWYGYPNYNNVDIPDPVPPLPPPPPVGGTHFAQYFRHPRRVRGN